MNIFFFSARQWTSWQEKDDEMKWKIQDKTENTLKQFKNTHLPVNREHSFAIEVLEPASEI